MPRFLTPDVILIRYPFSDLSASKVRPAVVVNAPHLSHDLLIVPLTSRTTGLLAGEFVLSAWPEAGLNLPTAVKRGLYTIEETLTLKHLGHLNQTDTVQLEQSLRAWLGLA